jgi:hypothetical protein
MAEGDPAVHATTGLLVQLGGVLLLIDLAPVQDAHVNRTA